MRGLCAGAHEGIRRPVRGGSVIRLQRESSAKIRNDMGPVELYMTFDSVATLEHELTQNLRFGRAVVQMTNDGEAQMPPLLSDCTLVLLHPEGRPQLSLPAQIVMVDDASPEGTSLGIQMRPFDEAVAARLEAFAGRDPTACEPAKGPTCSDHQAETRPAQLRRLSYNDQQKVARTGILGDRVTVERLYGKSVWKSLLENPKLTVPEVARIARKGTVPRPLLEMILDNNAWVQATTVRRALMGNPKVTPEGILKLLRLTPRHELRAIHRGTAYSSFVREQARKLLA